MNSYEQQAEDFCQEYNVSIDWAYVIHTSVFDDDRWQNLRAKWIASVKRGNVCETFEFHDSLIHSYRFRRPHAQDTEDCQFVRADQWQDGAPARHPKYGDGRLVRVQTAPTSYDLLACLQHYDPGTLDEFCRDFGYNPDSKRDTETYLAVQREWAKVRRLFDDCLDALQEIQ